jgi:hypothetical protein
MTTDYIETDPLEWGDLVAIPHFKMTVETSREDWGTDIIVTAELSHVSLGYSDTEGRVDGIELTAAQAIRIWGEDVAAWEEAAAAAYDGQAALDDDADELADYQRAMREDAA